MRFTFIFSALLLSHIFTIYACCQNKDSNAGFTFSPGQKPPGEVPALFAPEIFNHPTGYHSPPVFSPDGSEIYFSPMERGSLTEMIKISRGRWSKAVQINFGIESGAGDPVLSPDGRRIYFLSFRPLKNDPVERERIWSCVKTDTGWSVPVVIDENIRKHPTHWTFSVASNYNLYFLSEIKANPGIYLSRFNGEKYLEPVRLGKSINRDGTEFCPHVAPDESFLLFSRNGSGTKKADIFVSFRKKDGTWTIACPIDKINSPGNDLAPVLSPGGKYIFFLSNRSGTSRIYWVDAQVIRELRRDN